MMVFKNRKVMPPELEVEAPPLLGMDLLSTFWTLFSREGISFQDIYYYQEVYHVELSGGDIDILKHLSSFAVNWIAKREKSESKH